MSIIEKDKKYVANTYKRFPVEIASGSGCIAKDINGKEYIDLGAGIGVSALGYSEKGWIDAVTKQLGLIQHTSNLYYTDPCAELAKQLCERTGMKKVFFSNSGAEANECAIKVARKYAAQNRGSEHYTIVTLNNSFHGRTITTLAATGQAKFHEDFQPLTPGFVHADPCSIYEFDAIAAKYKPAAVMFECIQGEGGVVPLDDDYIKEVYEYSRKHNILVIVDEVQTGNGRTGKLYSYMHYGIEPDIVTTAKGLSGGLPLGATLLSEKVENVLGFGDHGSTFGGNPVCCSGALYVLSKLNDEFFESVKSKGELIKTTLQDCKGIESVTGLGLMVGIKTTRPVIDVANECLSKGVLCLTAHDKVRLLPPLNIPEDLLVKALEVIKEVCAE